MSPDPIVSVNEMRAKMTAAERVAAMELEEQGYEMLDAHRTVWARRHPPPQRPAVVRDLRPARPLAPAPAAPAPAPLRLIDPSRWEGVEPPRREWAWEGYVPTRQATLLTGAGSAGKSLLGQQLATCAALGRPCLGVPVRETVALYVTCEDDRDELHRRQDRICYALEAHLSQLRGRLYLAALAGEIGNELCTFDASGQMQTMAAWDRLRLTLAQAKPGLVVLDNTAHLFAGNENDRHQVAAFCGLLNRLAQEFDCAVLFLGHPNKAGDSFSGSTAWENQVRSRLFLERPEPDAGEAQDPDARRLTREKANYAQRGGAIDFRWWGWAFVRDADMPAGEGAALAAQAKAAAEDARFLTCLAKATADRRAVSHQTGTNWAPRRFAGMPEAQGSSEAALSRAMERLFSASIIRADQQLWRGTDRHWKHGLKLVSECGDPPAATPCGDPR